MSFRFGPYCLDPHTGDLTGPEGPIPLRRQAFRLLEVLLDNAPALMDRDTLLDQVWGRTAISPNVLPQAISELRQALGDNPQQPQYIETLHRRGYRIACAVEKISPDQADDAEPESETESLPAVAPKPRAVALLMIGLVVTTVILVAVVSFWWVQDRDQRWLQRHALPEIRQLIETDVASAWQLARQARQRVENDPQLEQLWLDLTLPADIVSEPPGATVMVRGYDQADPGWVMLGTAPLEQERLPLTMLRFRLELDGHQTIETGPSILPVPEVFHLHRAEDTPEDMVFVPGGPVRYAGHERVVGDFWIDRHEVTNREYLLFVESGGYEQPEYWLEDLGAEFDHQAFTTWIADLVDATGRPGPATWAMGSYPPGETDHPVTGISWYEARAYARFSGKRLPSVFHWFRAAGHGTPQIPNFTRILSRSNFESRGTVPVGSLGGLGPYGTFDMAGNVREWCANASEERRHSLGGDWQSTSYQFRDVNAFDPMNRSPAQGLRLIQPVGNEPAELDEEIILIPRVQGEPTDDATFALFAGLYDYDPTPLEAQIDWIDDSHRLWQRQQVSFNAAYGDERIRAHLFLPRNATPPYQTVVHFPGGDSILLGDINDAGLISVEPFLRSGRAVIYPVYLGTFDRRPRLAPGPVGIRDLLIRQVQDVRRTIDYLHERGDIDTERLLYHGLSFGAVRGSYALAIEQRFRTAILVSGGMVATTHLPPEVQQIDYVPRIGMPLLLINGREDFNFPYLESQVPFYELLGTPEEKKRMIAFDWGHLPTGYTDLMREVVDWADHWLGPVTGPAGRQLSQVADP